MSPAVAPASTATVTAAPDGVVQRGRPTMPDAGRRIAVVGDQWMNSPAIPVADMVEVGAQAAAAAGVEPEQHRWHRRFRPGRRHRRGPSRSNRRFVRNLAVVGRAIRRRTHRPWRRDNCNARPIATVDGTAIDLPIIDHQTEVQRAPRRRRRERRPRRRTARQRRGYPGLSPLIRQRIHPIRRAMLSSSTVDPVGPSAYSRIRHRRPGSNHR